MLAKFSPNSENDVLPRSSVNLISCNERIIGKKGTVFVEEAMLVKQSRTFSYRENDSTTSK